MVHHKQHQRFWLAVVAALACTAPASFGKPVPAIGGDAPTHDALPPGLAPLADAAVLLSIEVGAHWNGPEAATLRQISKVHPIVMSWMAKDAENKLGLPADKIDRAALVTGNFQGYAVVLSSRQPYSRDLVVERLAPGAADKPFHGKSYFAGEGTEFGVAMIDDHNFAVGQRGAIGYVLDHWTDDAARTAKPSAARPPAAPLLYAQLKPASFRSAFQQAGPEAEALLPLLSAKVLRMSATASRGLRLKFQAEFSDEPSAKQAPAAMKKALEHVERYLATAETKMPSFLREQEGQYPGSKELAVSMAVAIRAARDGLRSAAYQQKGNLAEAVVTIRAVKPVTTAVLLMSLLPRAKKGEGE